MPGGVRAAVVALALLSGAVASAGEAKARAGRPRNERTPVPEGARLSIELDKPRFFLGENILLHVCLENAGPDPYRFNLGFGGSFGKNPGRFQVTAADEKGEAAVDPKGLGYPPKTGWRSGEIKPGEKYFISLPLVHYCRLEHPGAYTVRVTHDFGWEETPERRRPVGEGALHLVMPTEDQARAVVEDMERLPALSERQRGQKDPPYPDFSALRYPVYLPILLARAQGGSEQALEGIGSIETPEATRSLVELTGRGNAAFAERAAKHVVPRLPRPDRALIYEPGQEPVREPRPPSPAEEAKARLVAACWRPEFVPAVRASARGLLASPDDQAVRHGAAMLSAVGEKDDLAAVVGALDRLAPRTKNALRAPGSVRGIDWPCWNLAVTAWVLIRRGAEVPTDPKSPGENVVFSYALRARAGFRPPGWEATTVRLLQHEVPFVREIALNSLPRPLPKALIDLLPKLLADPDPSVASRACRAAAESKAPELCAPLLHLVATAQEKGVLAAAAGAARDLGARPEALEGLASRIDTTEIGGAAYDTLVRSVIVRHGGSGTTTLDEASAAAVKARWTRFLQDHRDALGAGQRFEVGDPALTPDLMAPHWKVRDRDGKEWP